MHALSPVFLEAAVVVLGVLMLFVEMFFEGMDKRFLAWLGILGLGGVLLASFSAGFPPTNTGALASYRAFYSADALAMFFKRFALLTTILVLVMSVDYLGVVRKFTPGAHEQGGLGEFLALPVLTCAGLMWMASAVDFVMIFVSLELVTISFYVLVSYTRRNAATLEAGVKYLILGALSTGFFVYGITWIYGLTGETNLDRIAVALARMYPASFGGSTAPILFAFVLVTIALGFKIAAVPFQIWVPDVYQGAPTPITAFLSVGSKAAGFVVFIRVLDTFFRAPAIAGKVEVVLVVLAAATLIYGNLAALPQNNLKRLLAYSSIAHAGYLLIAVASAARMSAGARRTLGGRGDCVLSGGVPADDAALVHGDDRRRQPFRRGRHRGFQRSRAAFAVSGVCDVDGDAVAGRAAVHGGVSGQVLRVHGGHRATAISARGAGSDRGGVRVLLLSAGRARDVFPTRHDRPGTHGADPGRVRDQGDDGVAGGGDPRAGRVSGPRAGLARTVGGSFRYGHADGG